MEECIRDKEGRIMAWCAGESEESINDFVRRHIADGAHRSFAKQNRYGEYIQVKKERVEENE